MYVKPEASLESIIHLFKQGYVHQAIVVNNPEKLVQNAEKVVQYLCCDKLDEQKLLLSQIEKMSQKHSVLGIVTMEKVLESYLNMRILDEKDNEKRLNQNLNDTYQNSSFISDKDHPSVNSM